AGASAACSLAFARRVLREMPKTSHGRAAGFLGPMPCARRQRSERRRTRSRRCSGVNRILGMSGFLLSVRHLAEKDESCWPRSSQTAARPVLWFSASFLFFI